MTTLLPDHPSLGWSPEVAARLCRLLDTLAAMPAPLAVFDCDNTCIFNDIGDALWVELVTTHALCWHHPALHTLLVGLDPDPDQALAIAAHPESVAGAPQHARYLERWLPLYPAAMRTLGKAEGLAWVARVMVGLPEASLQQRCQQLLATQLAAPLAEHALAPSFTAHHGLRLCHEVRLLIAALREREVDCKIVSASSRWPVQAVAPLLGLSPEDVIAIDLELDADRCLTDTVRPPITYRQGKVEAILDRCQRPPQLALGDAITDLEMLQAATHLGLLLHHRDEAVRAQIAQLPNVLVQPREQLRFVAQ